MSADKLAADGAATLICFFTVCMISIGVSWLIVDETAKRSTMEKCMTHFSDMTVAEARKKCDSVLVGALPTK